MVKGTSAGGPRKPRQAPKTKTGTPADERPVGVNHNATDEEQDKALNALGLQAAQQIEAKMRVAQAALADVKNIRKRAKAEGVSPARLNFILELRKDPEGATEKYQRFVADLQAAARWTSHDLRHQGVLFGELDETPVDEKAFEAGRQAGLNGENGTVPKHYAGTPAATKWSAGWQEGVETRLIGGIKKLDEEHADTKVVRFAKKDDGLGDAPDTSKTVN